MDKIRVLIVDDHPLMREALGVTIEPEADIDTVGVAVNGLEAVELAVALKPDVVLMDLYMPVMDGIEATRQIKLADPSIYILIITSSNEDEKIIAAIRAGASGYLLKTASRDQILSGLREVSQGGYYVPAEIGAKLANALQSEQSTPVALTVRENEVLTYVGQGLSNAEIASALVLSEGTVRVHISNIMAKLNLQSRAYLIVYAQKRSSFSQ